MHTVKSACPLDCWDACAILVDVDGNRAVRVKPDKRQEVTGNFLCYKGRRHLEKVYHPQRLMSPMRKVNGRWKPVRWHEALAMIADAISRIRQTGDSRAIVHYYDSGHKGILKQLDNRFYSCLGGVTVPTGTLCWGAGLQAQKYDFGDVLSHSYQDLTRSRLVIFWSRNPVDTNVHLLPFLKKARANGTRMIVIDPVNTRTAQMADLHLSPRPSTDGALALAIAHVIIAEQLHDASFVAQNTSGFADFAAIVKDCTPAWAAAITGIDAAAITSLARTYATTKPAAIRIGYGLQRYTNSGNTVRAVDALAALTGNLGKAGGGASYANLQSIKCFDHRLLSGADLQPEHRFFVKPQLSRFLNEAQDPPVEMIVFSRGNPLSQMGDRNALLTALDKISFKVAIDMFMTDTAEACDLVLPCTSFLEAEDVYSTPMGHTYLNYGSKAIDPPGECRPELQIYTDLAEMLDLQDFPRQTADAWLRRIIMPLTRETGVTLDRLKKSPLKMPHGVDIPWQDGRFATPDGRYNFFSIPAQQNNHDPLPVYRPALEAGNPELRKAGYDLYYLTPHPARSLHSQHYILEHVEPDPLVYLNPDTAAARGLREGDSVRLSSPRGTFDGILRLRPGLRADTAVVYEGRWAKRGGSVNALTADYLSDMGMQAALYDCMCRIDRR